MSVVAMLQGDTVIDRGTVQTAMALARRLGVDLKGLCALPDPRDAMMVVATPEAGGLIAAAAPAVYELQAEILTKARTVFSDFTGSGAHGLATEFVHEVASPERSAVNAAALADALVFPRDARRAASALSLAFERVLMDARLPLVVSGARDTSTGPVVIGWDGSNGAARAVRFHSNLIRSAGEVIIAHNRKDTERQGARPISEPEALKAWLDQRKVKNRIEPISGDVGTALLVLARAAEASLIVAGAYGHSRLTERMFGGATRRLLETEDAPALALAH